jgi:transcriptional regulator with XRE-family HTH domain
MENDKNENGQPLGAYLGAAIRQLRSRHDLTIADVADRAGISRGMLSKIENAQTATSLETLAQIANALGITLSQLFSNFDKPRGGAQLVKSGKGMEVVRRGTRNGHTYHLLAYDQGPKKYFEPFLITLEDPGEKFAAFEHVGTEFLYMLEGKLEYRVGEEVYLLEAGDSLTFRGEIPHRPERMLQMPIRFLAIIHYDSANEDV